MAKQTIKIELNNNDLKEIIAKEFNLKLDKMVLRVHHYPANQREPEFTNIVVESERVLTDL